MFGPHACRLSVVPGAFVLTVLAPWTAWVYVLVMLAVLRRFEPGLRAAQARRDARALAVAQALAAARHTNLADLRAVIAAHRGT